MIEESLIVALTAVISVRILMLIAFRTEAPEYMNRMSIYASSVFGATIGVSLPFLLEFENILQSLSYSISASIMMWNAVHSLFTDAIHFRMDRWVLRVSILISAIVSLPEFFLNRAELLPVFLVMVLIASATFLIDSLGASDTRAFVLTVVASFMNLSFVNFYAAVIISSLSIIIVGIILAIKNRSMKVRVPLIPPILLPFAVIFLIPVL